MNLSSNPITYIIASVLDADLLNKTKDLTSQLQDEAAKAGWPIAIVTQLGVRVLDGDLDIDIPATIKEQVEILEYGTETTPPNPVLRNFMMSLRKRTVA